MTNASERLLRWIFDRSAPITFFVLFLFGAIMLVASAATGVAFFEIDWPGEAGATVRKQVGFIWALNWSFMFLVGFPIMIFFMIETATHLRRALDRLVERRMIVDAGWRPVGIEALAPERDRFWRRSATAGGLLLVALMAYCLWEWYRVSGMHLFAGTMPIAAGETHWLDELDWSVAALLPGPRSGDWEFRMANAALSFASYFVMGLYLSIVFTYYAMIVLYADLFRRMSTGRVEGGLRIVPEIDDDDPRRGFGVFQPMFRSILLATLMGFLMCYFMNIQNLFLRSGATDLWAFVSEYVSPGFAALLDGQIKEGLKSIGLGLGNVGYAFNITSVWSIMLVFGFFSAVALALAWTLSQTAEQGREELRRYVRQSEGGVGHLTKHPPETALTRLDAWDAKEKRGMQVWPFGSPELSQLLLFLAVGAICIVVYPIGLFFAGAGIAWVLVSATGIFRKR